MSMYAPPAPGLGTVEAFDKLFQEITTALQVYRERRKQLWFQLLKSSFSTRSPYTYISWCSILMLLGESLLIFVLWGINGNVGVWKGLYVEATFIFLIALFNASLVLFENYKRINELPVKIEKTMCKLKDLVTHMSWKAEHYPDLYTPYSPCINLQWCYRDSTLCNIPWSFLVPGDLIILQPAQKIIAKCYLFNNDDMVFNPGDIFNPSSEDAANHRPEADKDAGCKDKQDTTGYQNPKLHVPLDSFFAVVLESPYKAAIDLALDKFLERPVSFYTKERHRTVTGIVECIILPTSLMVFVSICIVRMFYLPHWLGIRVAPWTELLILQPIVNTFSLIPVSLPFIQILLQTIGSAKIHTLFNLVKGNKQNDNVFHTVQPGSSTCWYVDLTLRSIYKEVWQFFVGREETLHRSQKLLHVLATVTALTCVDKKGILSWPNPTADKVFFLRTAVDPETKKRKCIPEVLDITHDPLKAFELQFDDPEWNKHLACLKPIGLNILLNNCNYATRATYSTFHCHITNELQFHANDLVVPVTSRRCLCELAHIIGFKEQATSLFDLEQDLCSYRHIESDDICRDKMNKVKIKFPFPHMMSVIVREKFCQRLQLMSQGTGDMILDVCDDFWDGTDLRALNEEEKKLILDFYQRMSLTSVCAAFGYKPLEAKVSNNLSSLYMELPPSKGARYLPYYVMEGDTEFPRVPPRDSISTDCLYNLSEKRRSREKEVSDIDGYFDVQTNQIFLGMVAMQYEACMDMVQLIEQLDQACIRFVHFSKENELRSRLFSEKMGLESGWNCHISLRPLTTEEKDEEERLEKEERNASYLQRMSDSVVDCSKANTESVPSSGSRRPTLSELFGPNSFKRSSLNDSGDGSAVEDGKLLGRCSTSVPEMVHFSRFSTKRENTNIQEEEMEQLLTPTNNENVEQFFIETEEGDDALLNVTRTPIYGQQSGSEVSSIASAEHHIINTTIGDSLDCIRDHSPIATSSVKEKEAVIRFADSANDNEHTSRYGPNSSLRVSQGRRHRSATPTESFCEAYEMAEHRTPLGFDMSNRAKLPRGIEEVRPHLENVDNVPLLVSLFTDCTGDNTREMIKIMQDYGEVILLLGSVCNIDNQGLFLQADASIGLEPLYPQACQKQEVYDSDDIAKKSNSSPTEVAALLTSLPCSLFFKRNEPISFYHLIAHSRHFMNNCIRNTFQFWLCCQLSVTILGLISLLVLLPPLFTIGDTMWLSCFIIPALALALSFATMDTVESEVMELASWKNQVMLDRGIVLHAIYFYGMRFLPSLLNVAAMAAFNLRSICDNHLKSMENTCSWVYPVVTDPTKVDDVKIIMSNGTSLMKCISSWACGDNADKLLFIQQFSMFSLVLYFIIISSSFVYRSKHLWDQSPCVNKTWTSVTLSLLILQFLYAVHRLGYTFSSFHLLPGYSYGWAVIFGIIVLAFNELLRRQENKINLRYQKRARLDYGTKLGMHSPV